MSQREKILLLVGVILIICGLAISEWLVPPAPQPSSPRLHVEQSMTNPPFPQSGFALNLSEAKRALTLENPRNIFAPLKNHRVPKKIQAPPPPKRPSPPPPKRLSPPPPQSYRPAPPPQPTGPSPAELAVRQAQEEMQQYTFLMLVSSGMTVWNLCL